MENQVREKTGQTLDDLRIEQAVAQAVAQERARLTAEYEEKITAAGKAKTDFLLNMSHDIRTPMNAIIGFTQMALKNANDQYMVKECMEKVRSASGFLMSLLDDALDMAKIEQGKFASDEDEVILAELLITLENMFRESAEEKKLKLTFDCDELEHDVVWADELHLTRVFMNLISNAVKYTRPEGCVDVTLSEMPGEDAEHGLYVFTVKDNGIGMSAEFVSHIFEQFARERNTTSSGIQGTGLGMAITKNLVDMMNGTIDIQSEPNSGTTVVATFPFRFYIDTPRRSKSLRAMEERSMRFEGMRILLAEDNLLNREIAVDVLNDLGIVTEEAEDGSTAVEMVRRSAPGYYNLVLMDIQMPYMDGYQATSVIRRLDDKELASIPIYALSANVYPEQKRKSLEVGMNGHIGKPLNIDELSRVLLENAPEGGVQMLVSEEPLPVKNVGAGLGDDLGESCEESAIDSTRYTILITDDSDINRRFLKHMLQDHYNVVEAKNGQEALDVLRSGETPIHLILLDLSMPVMTGFEFMEIWREDPELSSIPIMVETAGAVSEGEINSLRLGASDFVKRPYQSEVILHRVANVLRNRFEMAGR